MSPPVIEVAAGLIFRAGRLLLAQRAPSAHLGGLWEFPGGKRHAGETFAQCLQRELREELGVEVEVGELVDTITHAYAEKCVQLQFFRCRLVRGEPQPLECPALQWVRREDLGAFEFPAADARLIERLQTAAALWR